MDEARRVPEAEARAVEELRLFFERIRYIVLFVSADDGRIELANRAALVAYGYGESEILGLPVADLLSREAEGPQSPLDRDGIRLIPEEGTLFEDVHRRKDGSTFPVEVDAWVGQAGAGHAVVAVVRDITERKRTELALRAASAEIEQVFETAADGMRIIGRDRTVTRVNRTLVDMSGFSADETIGMKCCDVFPGSACGTPDCSLTRVLGGSGKFAVETEKRRRDGSTLECVVTVQPFVVDGEIVRLADQN
jgi:PAS domain S-box-containing protein